MQLDEMTLQTFEPLVGSNFKITFQDHEPIELKITGVKPVMERVVSTRIKRQPFVVFLEGDGTFFLPQRMYDFSHEVLGEHLPIFIVPTGKLESTYQYEAVFT